MTLKLVFLGKLEDLAGAGERVVPMVGSVTDAIAGLEAPLAAAVTAPRVRCAVNGVLLQAADSPPLHDGDEIAFLPPVSGG